jgi:Trk K+ transport system NAD-binding subunit
MVGTGGRLWARLKVTYLQNRVALWFLVGWLGINGLVFSGTFRLPAAEAALVALCIHKIDSTWGRIYALFTELVVFGAVASVVITNVTRRYRPEATCAALAAEARGHLVIIGYSNLGNRLRAMAVAAGGQAVVVEEDRGLVEQLIRSEDPLVLGSAREPATIEAAGVRAASVVVIATDDLEAAAVACRLVRAENPRCKLVVRCPDDDVGQVLAKAYGARCLSTSKIAAQMVLAQAVKAGSRKALVVGVNNVGRRVAAALEQAQVACALIPETEDVAVLERAGVSQMDLVVIADDDLGKNLVRVDRIRDTNPHALLVCRVFHEEAAEILTHSPFRCVLLSSSRLAADTLASEGVLRDVGVTKAYKKGPPREPAKQS